MTCYYFQLDTYSIFPEDADFPAGKTLFFIPLELRFFQAPIISAILALLKRSVFLP